MTEEGGGKMEEGGGETKTAEVAPEVEAKAKVKVKVQAGPLRHAIRARIEITKRKLNTK